MRGLVLSGPRTIEYRTDLPDPRIEAETDAVVEVRLAGICGSDLHPYEEREPVGWGVVPGHEAAGVVREVGPAVRRFRPGDRVALPFSTSCGACRSCRRGLSARCVRGELFGWADPAGTAGLDGTQAEFVRVPLADATLIALEDHRSDAEGVLLGDNFTTGFFCASRVQEGAGPAASLGILIGCGAVGLSALVSALHLYGCRIVAVDPVASRREAALRLGADSATGPDQATEVLAEFDHSHVDFVMEAVGSPAARALSVALVSPGGRISSVGVPSGEFGVAPADLYDRNLAWSTGRCPVTSILPDVEKAIQEGLRIPVEELMPRAPVPLASGPEAYASFAARIEGELKPTLLP